MENSGLTPVIIDKLRAIFARYAQVESVVMFGSRAMGNYKPASDIDLTVLGQDIDLSLLTKIEFDLDDLMLPYKFDISAYDKIVSPELIDHIDRVGKVIYARATHSSAANTSGRLSQEK